jgi:Flp pilus assembly protein TadD
MSDRTRVGARTSALLLCALLGSTAGLTPVSLAEITATVPPHEGYVGRGACQACHAAEAAAWQGSHHDRAMEEATPQTVLGDFNDARFEHAGVESRFLRQDGRFVVRTDGPDGRPTEFPVRYTFGVYPLQQYLVELPGGRLQALGLAWDSRPAEARGQRWIHLYPGQNVTPSDPLHWTGRLQNWNYMCAECHSTDLRKGYDAAGDRYRTTWAEIDVSCEACHGPGAGHLAWARARERGEATGAPDRGLAVALDERRGVSWTMEAERGIARRSQPRATAREIETCARCHSRRALLDEPYLPGRPIGDTHRVSLLDEGLYFADGQIRDEVYEYGSYLQSAMHRAGVTCSDCHEPHGLRLRGQGNAPCTGCHLADRFDTPQHHRHPAGSPGAACVACHMPTRTYMVVDDRRDHSFRVPRPDLSRKVGSPDPCTGCHHDRDTGWATEAVSRWHGPDGRQGRPHYGEVLHAGRTGEGPDTEGRLLGLAGDSQAPGIVRATALDLLGRYLTERSLLTLSRAVGDADPLVRRAALGTLEALPRATRLRLGAERLADPVREVRLEAARVLAELTRSKLPEARQRALAAALDEYRAAQGFAAEPPEAHLNLGLLAIRTGDAAGAEAAYRRSLALDPAFVPGYVNLADLSRARGQEAEAERVLTEGLAHAPQSADLHHAVGLLRVRQKRLPQAVAALGRAAELTPDNAHFAYVHALALRESEGLAAAVAALERARG